ncbi:hypothetical protein K6L44_16835 [Gluconacetobacter entanii]|uniref:hypothetical protein n=1 Tax=Gluconacetobacter entanii TaxID=108528 RepID=UPI001C935A31|nr:hypothetical protein [Gluconacetobacter entanii]MBY4641618.1 hypothetical protein [Gluconacetobacter entanii]MCW4580614.1 hypothetical protein [Gluconacetobacter entanii]MCW4583996.1 hypothetical protein [Gluconacetobacter entanii]MCW4587288.1 hypothetical protein [Gluconacetobacter entanii]
MVRVPDVLVPAQGRMLAVVDGPDLLVGPRGHVDRFVLGDWARVLDRRAGSLADGMATPDGRLTCRAGVCVLVRGGHRIMMELRGGADPSCVGVDVLVTLSGGHAACRDVVRIDALTLWRSGAQALYLDPSRGGGGAHRPAGAWRTAMGDGAGAAWDAQPADGAGGVNGEGCSGGGLFSEGLRLSKLFGKSFTKNF